MRKQYKWIKVVDVNDNGWEYENCQIVRDMFGIKIILPSEKEQEVSVYFPYDNIISVRTVRDV